MDIDIKPGSWPNAINLGSNGVIPVAILSSQYFDATTVKPESVELGGVGAAVRTFAYYLNSFGIYRPGRQLFCNISAMRRSIRRHRKRHSGSS
ncbi:MAG: hypothetical protein MUO27_02470 [Sedimentisphaerales bacterium]|nr:hypothetical protein [Sedimentisphaerales bacterium]